MGSYSDYMFIKGRVDERIEVVVLISPSVDNNFVSGELAFLCGDFPNRTDSLLLELNPGRHSDRIALDASCTARLPPCSYRDRVQIVLGLRWLSTLGSITWNFRRRTIKYRTGEGEGRQILLHALDWNSRNTGEEKKKKQPWGSADLLLGRWKKMVADKCRSLLLLKNNGYMRL